MRVITSDPMPGYRTCGRPTIADQDYGDTVLPDDCPSYLESAPALIVREEVQYTFRDGGSDGSPGMDHDSIERSVIRYLPADGDWTCPDCGFEMSAFTLEPRPTYRHVSDQNPEELRRRTLRQAEKTLDVQTRQALALEALAAGQQPTAQLDALRAEIADLRAQLANGNGHDPEAPTPAARPRKRSTP